MRPNALAAALQLTGAQHTVELRSVVPSGDCFYDAMDLLLSVERAPQLAQNL